jgi:hypothetical protein
VPQGRIERQSGVPRRRGARRLYSDNRQGSIGFFLCFSGGILSSPVAAMIAVAATDSQEFTYSHRLLARGSQCHRHDFKHRVGMPRRRQER